MASAIQRNAMAENAVFAAFPTETGTYKCHRRHHRAAKRAITHRDMGHNDIRNEPRRSAKRAVSGCVSARFAHNTHAAAATQWAVTRQQIRILLAHSHLSESRKSVRISDLTRNFSEKRLKNGFYKSVILTFTATNANAC